VKPRNLVYILQQRFFVPVMGLPFSSCMSILRTFAYAICIIYVVIAMLVVYTLITLARLARGRTVAYRAFISF